MILLLSGEGPTDIGTSSLGTSCKGDEFQAGPMAHLIEQLLEPCLSYSVVEYARLHDHEALHFLTKADLSQKARAVRNPKAALLTGDESKVGTLFHRKFAYTLGVCAKDLESQQGDSVMVILFRDSDGTQSCPRTDWQDKRDSIEKGFEAARFYGGVAMVPKPKSEAWLLCALQRNYQHCESLEDESGNDNSPENLKDQLMQYLGYKPNVEQLNTLVIERRIVALGLNMTSFVAFRNSLAKAAQYNNLDVSALE